MRFARGSGLASVKFERTGYIRGFVETDDLLVAALEIQKIGKRALYDRLLYELGIIRELSNSTYCFYMLNLSWGNYHVLILVKSAIHPPDVPSGLSLEEERELIPRASKRSAEPRGLSLTRQILVVC